LIKGLERLGGLVRRTGFDGLEVRRTGFDGLEVRRTGFDGLEVRRTGFEGLEVRRTGFGGASRLPKQASSLSSQGLAWKRLPHSIRSGIDEP
jgi:hypothetical protein